MLIIIKSLLTHPASDHHRVDIQPRHGNLHPVSDLLYKQRKMLGFLICTDHFRLVKRHFDAEDRESLLAL